MNPSDYIEAASRTNGTANSDEMVCGSQISFNTLHMAVGLTTESGELQDMLKKTIFYNKDIDMVNMKEEIGDLLWYVAGLLKEHNWTFEEVMQINIDKLRARYPEKFTSDDALNRDLEKERAILEG